MRIRNGVFNKPADNNVCLDDVPEYIALHIDEEGVGGAEADLLRSRLVAARKGLVHDECLAVREFNRAESLSRRVRQLMQERGTFAHDGVGLRVIAGVGGVTPHEDGVARESVNLPSNGDQVIDISGERGVIAVPDDVVDVASGKSPAVVDEALADPSVLRRHVPSADEWP